MKKFIVLAIILLLVVVSIGLTRTGADDSDTIRLGSILILSGEGAAWGEAARNGINMAITEVNERGGVLGKTLTITHEDDGSDPARALGAYRKHRSSGIDFIIGTNWSNTGVAVAPRAIEDGIVMVSPSLGVREFNEASDHLFNTWPHDEILSGALADLVFEQGHRRVALFGAQQNWVEAQTRAFTERFLALGGTVAFSYEPPIETTDVRSEIAKMRADPSIDAIVMTIDGYSLTNIVAIQLKALGVNLPLYSITIDRQIIGNCQGACAGMIFPTFLTPTEDFERRYKTRYNREVEIGADSGYDAVMMLAEAMEATHTTDPDLVAAYLNKITEYEGASGHLISDGKGAFTKDFVLMRVMEGEPTRIE